MNVPRAEAVAGAHGVVRLLVPSDVDMPALEQLVASTQARVVMCELADDPQSVSIAAVMRRSGFVEEGRVPDYYADGVALRILVKRTD